MFTILLTKKEKMKKIFLFVSPLIFLVACSSGDNSSCSDQDIVELQRSYGISKEEARKLCLRFEKIANDANNR